MLFYYKRYRNLPLLLFFSLQDEISPYTKLYSPLTVVFCVHKGWLILLIQYQNKVEYFCSSYSLPRDLITVKCKACLTASIMVSCADAVVRQNQWMLPNFWRVRFLDFPLHQTRRIHFALLASYITHHSPNEKPVRSRARKSSLMISLYKDNIR